MNSAQFNNLIQQRNALNDIWLNVILSDKERKTIETISNRVNQQIETARDQNIVIK